MKRTLIAACVLLAGLGGLCTAWYASSQRALDAELREREHRAMRTAAEREREIAEDLAKRLEELRVAESQRPYLHYQNLYHDPKGASEGLSVVPSPLASAPENPLIAAHFQIDANNRVTLPTLNEEIGELNASNAAEQRAIRDALAKSVTELREAASPLVMALDTEAATTRATAARIAELEERLAAAIAKRSAPEIIAKNAPPQKLDIVKAPPLTLEAINVQSNVVLDSDAVAQNSRSNEVYREIKQRGVSSASRQQQAQVAAVPEAQPPAPVQAESPPPAPPQTQTPTATPVQPRRRPPQVEIRSTDLQWHTVKISGKEHLVALRGVRTPASNLVQGILTPLAENAPFAGGTLHRSITGWRVQLDPAATLATIHREQLRVRESFTRTFAGVTMLLLLVVAGIVWMVWRTEALAIEKSRFAATAAHELRTPLASLRLYSEMIADERDPARRERYAREIAGQTERLGRLVANVLEVTRIERGTFALKPAVGHIGRAIEQCIEKLRPQMEAAGCPVELRVADDLPAVAFDADALHNVVDNLLDNAEKYSRDVPSRDVSVAVEPDSGGVAITVSDRGPGVPEDVFRDPRPFRHSAGGLGIGLFLVDRIVRGHGGVIRSASRPGGGAVVRIFLPAFYKA